LIEFAPPRQLNRWACSSLTSNNLNTTSPNWRTYILWGILFSLIIVPLVITFTYSSLHEGDASKPFVPELKKIADQTPVYPDFQRIGDDYVVLKDGRASLQRSFRTNAQFADIRKFYDAALANAGWRPPEVPPPSMLVGKAHHVTYHRGSYEFGVYQDNGLPNVYSIAVVWSE
jgi:hypothetical protein